MFNIRDMRMSEGVEWATHCCTLLAALPPQQALPASRLAEFHEVPPAYLAKHLQALAAAGIVTSTSGPRGGYRLARPAGEITLLAIVLAVDGDDSAFRCTEIRRRGPAHDAKADYAHACGIARAMWRAEDAWRKELEATTLLDILGDLFRSVSPGQLQRGAEWIEQVSINRTGNRTGNRTRRSPS
jgi:Rrf2 family protein